jgi:hypothetical protein
LEQGNNRADLLMSQTLADLTSEIGHAERVVNSASEFNSLIEKRTAAFTKQIENAKGSLATAKQAATEAGTAPDDAEKVKAARQAADDAIKFSCNAINFARIGGGAGAKNDEWKECRATIDRFDKLLVDLRKTGFGFVAALVSAASFVFGPDKVNARLTVLFMLVLLIGTLYLVDVAHQLWLQVAVERAKELEVDLDFEITTRISVEFEKGRARLLAFFLYFTLLFATCATFWFTIPERWDDGHRLTVGLALIVGFIFMIAADAEPIFNWARDQNEARKAERAEAKSLPSAT